MTEPALVRAAGGVVYREQPGGVEVLLVHRPRYDDWSLPKGKADGAEADEDTARREVEEETGLRCRLVREVGETRYRDSRGRPKVVRYWVMVPVDEGSAFVPNAEVDELRWCSISDALGLLSYAHDRELLARAGGPAA